MNVLFNKRCFFWCRNTAWFVIFLLGAKPAIAADHPACKQISYDFYQHTAEELRAIAAGCNSKLIAQLYYNRAYHMALLAEAEVFNELVTDFPIHTEEQVVGYKMYIALTEQLATVWFPDLEQRLHFLNNEYARSIEVMELRLSGYYKLASKLEQRIQ